MALHDYFEQSDGRLLEQGIQSLSSYGYNPGLARPDIRWLESSGILARAEDDEGPGTGAWILTFLGAEIVDTLVQQRFRIGSSDERDVWETELPELSEIARKQLTDTVSELAQIVEQKNDFPDEGPYRRDQIAGGLRAVLSMLARRVTPSRGQLREMVLKPAKWLAQKFTSQMIGIAAQHLYDLVTGYLS